MIPHPSLGVDRFADGAQKAQRIEAVTEHVVITPTHESADGGRGRVENGDAVAVDHLPETVGLGLVGRAFVQEDGGAIGEQAVNDVTVTGNPADVGGAEIAVGFFEIENVVRREFRAEQVARARVKHALGFAGRAARIENEKWVLGVESFGFVVVGRAVPSVLPPNIAALFHGDGITATFDDDHALDRGRAFDGFVDVGFELDDFTAPPATVGGDDEFGFAVVDAVFDGLGAEAAEDHGVNGTDASAGQHRDHGLGDHGQVKRDAIAGADAHVFKNVREAAHMEMQLFISDRADITGLTFENQRSLVLAGGAEVAVEAVFGNVEFAADEPLRVRWLPIEDFLEWLAPDELLGGLSAPEFFWGVDRLRVQPLIGGIAPKICLGFELGRGPE